MQCYLFIRITKYFLTHTKCRTQTDGPLLTQSVYDRTKSKKVTVDFQWESH